MIPSAPRPLPDGFPLSKDAQARRVWSCPKGDAECSRSRPCRSCMGRRSRRRGQVKQREAAKALRVPTARFSGQNAHEENWLGALRIEVKSGARMAGPVGTQFLAAERQSEQNRPVGDLRPFAAVFMPPGIADGVLAIRLSSLHEAVEALHSQLFGESA